MQSIRRGDIYYIRSDYPPTGSEQGANRPGVIVSNDICSKHSPVISVVYLTTRQSKKPLPTHINIRCTRPSMALCEQVHSVSVKRLDRYLGHITEREEHEIDEALRVSLAINNEGIVQMNELIVFNKEVIPVYTTDTGEKIVIGRELHERLKISERYSKWFDRMAGYGFEDDSDYTLYQMVHPQNGQGFDDHYLRLEMAKHISMIQRTPEGKEIRDKLIALETNVSELSPELRLLINMEIKQKQQDRAIEETNNKVDSICNIVALNPNSWRPDARSLIVKIAQGMGGNDFIRDVQHDIFKLVDQRAGVSLETRLTNKRRRMADEGVCKSRRDKLTKVDVIADDKKLIEIYLAVVKEYAIKYGVSQAS